MKNKLLKKFFIVPILISQLFLTSCWDKVELENRGFVNAIGIDKYKPSKESMEFEGSSNKNRYNVSMVLPTNEFLADSSGGDADSKTVKIAANETVSAAMRIIDSNSSQKLYFGHTKANVFGKAMLEDEQLFREAIDALERNRELSRKLIILSADGTAEDVLSGELVGEPLLGMFVSNFYKNNSSTVAIAFRQDLESLIRQLRSTNCAIIPKIELKDKELKLGGAAVMKDFKLVGWLDDQQTRGYLWLKSETDGAQVVAPYESTYVPLRVSHSRCHVSFREEGDQIICDADIKVKGSIEEFIFNNETLSDPNKLQALSLIYEDTIAREILTTYDHFQHEFRVDGFDFKDEIRKRAYTIYLPYEDNWDAAQDKIVIVPHVAVTITSTGSIQ